jgi:hypothetical protein
MQQVRIQPDGEMWSSSKTYRIVAETHKEIIALCASWPVPTKLDRMRAQLKNKAFSTSLIPWIHSPWLCTVCSKDKPAEIFDNDDALPTTRACSVKALQAEAIVVAGVFEFPIVYGSSPWQRSSKG